MNEYHDYIQNIEYKELFGITDENYIETIKKQIEYFTETEAKERDKIILVYFGKEGIERIIDIISQHILDDKNKKEPKILDAGAGSGFFTVKIANKIWEKRSNVTICALDATPAMIMELRKKNRQIRSFVGIAENIKQAIEYANKYLKIPDKYDYIYSILTLHHCQDIRLVFNSFKEVLNDDGNIIILDLNKHPYKEFREEMGDIHLGFDKETIKEIASEYFDQVDISIIPGLHCVDTGRAVSLLKIILK